MSVERAIRAPAAGSAAWRSFYASLRAETDALWVASARELGFGVERARGAFVSYDGAGTIAVAPYDEMDPDDHLAQIVVHELAHFAVEGAEARARADWGLDNMSDAHVANELAALRVQAWWCDAHGLRDVLVPTTAFREAWPAIGAAPLAPPAGAWSATIEGTRVTPHVRATAAALAHAAPLREELARSLAGPLAATARCARDLSASLASRAESP